MCSSDLLIVVENWSIAAGMIAGLSIGVVSGLFTSMLIVNIKLPPFIATLGVMGIARGLAFIITEGQYYDVSGKLPPGWHPLGIPIDWLAPVTMFAAAIVFQILMTRFQWGRAVFSIGASWPARSPCATAPACSMRAISTSFCAMSGQAIRPGDAVYKPNPRPTPVNGDAMILASVLRDAETL